MVSILSEYQSGPATVEKGLNADNGIPQTFLLVSFFDGIRNYPHLLSIINPEEKKTKKHFGLPAVHRCGMLGSDFISAWRARYTALVENEKSTLTEIEAEKVT